MSRQILLIGGGRRFLESVQTLQGREFQLATCDTVEAALKMAGSNPFELVLLDTGLSGIDARDLCMRLKSGPHRPAVIAISPNPRGPEEMELLEAGADDYLGADSSPEILLAKIRLQLRLRNALSRLTPTAGPARPCASELEQLVTERTREMIATNGISVLTLTTLAESREMYAEDRLLRMRYYSSLLATELSRRGPEADQIDVTFLQQLYRAVPLHDIGKIAISDAILLKPGRLTPVERKTMEEHTTIGAIILEQLALPAEDDDFLTMARVLARRHHERFDGTGYPSGLAGRDIPLPARIVAVADVYDALTTPRPYRETVHPETARVMIEEQSDRQFDPAVVEAFGQCFRDFVNVQSRFDYGSPTITGAACFLD